MSKENQINRRAALKVIAVGVGTASTLPMLETHVRGQHPEMQMGPTPTALAPAVEVARFFDPQELETIAAISDLIIPTDEHSPGARAAGVSGFIDLMVNESPNEVKTLWREGLAAVNRMSELQCSAVFIRASQEQQTALLKTISKNERRPKTIEERFFVAVKSMTVDAYYTSPIGIHQDLQYKGNAVLKEFAGCTHPEHRG
jgi:gluconate 2-dehydrogenase gamma chain